MKKVFLIAFSLSLLLFSWVLRFINAKTEVAKVSGENNAQKSQPSTKLQSCNFNDNKNGDGKFSYAYENKERQPDCVFYGCSTFEAE